MAYKFDLDGIQNYICSLCVRHKDLQHSNANRSFARFHLEEEMSDLQNSAAPNVVVVAAINGRRIGDRDDRMLQREIVLRIVCYAADSSADAIKGAESKAEAIMMDLMTEMEHQQEIDMDADVCGVMEYLQPERFSWEPVEDQPWLVNHYGWDLVVPFKALMPTRNPDNWT